MFVNTPLQTYKNYSKVIFLRIINSLASILKVYGYFSAGNISISLVSFSLILDFL